MMVILHVGDTRIETRVTETSFEHDDERKVTLLEVRDNYNELHQMLYVASSNWLVESLAVVLPTTSGAQLRVANRSQDGKF